MGVVRDVTIEQLTQAVSGIDTGGLAKDTTLQATNTALSNINTTLRGITTNDPPTDTTQQSIAAAITGLATALGSDKANIDGSNIANPSAFRTAIGLNGTFYHDVKIASGTLNAYTGGTDIFDIPTPSASANRYILLAWNSTLGQDMIICKFSSGQISCSKKVNQNDQVFIQGFIF